MNKYYFCTKNERLYTEKEKRESEINYKYFIYLGVFKSYAEAADSDRAAKAYMYRK